jgi:hypothetical protein
MCQFENLKMRKPKDRIKKEGKTFRFPFYIHQNNPLNHELHPCNLIIYTQGILKGYISV